MRETVNIVPATVRAACREAGGACGDLGTLLPYALGVLATGVLAPAAVFAGFGLAYVATGLIYAMPVAVQPMKAVAAVVLTQGLTAPEIAATGMTLGVLLLVLAATGAIDRIARFLPQSVISGLQLGLGLSLGLFGLSLIGDQWWVGALALVALIGLGRLPHCPAALVVVAGAAGLNAVFGAGSGPIEGADATAWFTLPEPSDFVTAFGLAVLPQLPLTLTNAVIVTAALARDLMPAGAHRVSERRLAVTSGAFNLLLAPFGALPMCHGAGGLAAHHRFGARSGAAVVILGAILLAFALMPASATLGLLAQIPMPVLGALLIVTAADLAISPRLFDAKPSCRPVILLAGVATVVWNPAIGLAAGWVSELIRQRIVRSTLARSSAENAD